MSIRVLITGITGQDGSFLAEFLLEKATRSMASNVAHLRSTLSALTIFMRMLTSTMLGSSFIMAI